MALGGRDRQARKARLAALMARLAGGDTTAAFLLAGEYSGEIGAAVRRHLADLGVHDVEREALDELVMDVCLMLADIAGAWKADGGAAPWQWAWHRVRTVVSRWVGQHADALDDAVLDREAPAASPGDEPDVVDVLAELAVRSEVVALVRDGLEAVASPRDGAILLEFGVQAILGDPSPAVTVATLRGMTPEAVRQVVSRTRRRLRGLAEGDARFAPLAELPLAA